MRTSRTSQILSPHNEHSEERLTRVLLVLPHHASLSKYALIPQHTADMIHDKDPLVNTYISVPKDFGHLNCAAFVAGAVHGMLESGSPPSSILLFHPSSLSTAPVFPPLLPFSETSENRAVGGSER